jgi:hypothetical protein
VYVESNPRIDRVARSNLGPRGINLLIVAWVLDVFASPR